ncbi:MAG: nucleotidyltransferase family protein, partial [Candidatus Korarchaeota archaeon]|nr:nucleotidyltransferase family protein [Candidatus Korarchaeota archaeon]
VISLLRDKLLEQLDQGDRVLSYILMPSEEVTVGWEGIDWLRLLGDASRNGVELALLKRIVRLDSLPPEMEKIVRIGLQICYEMMGRIRRTIQLLKETLNVDFIIFKTSSDEIGVPTDVDVLVKPEDFDMVRKSLRDLGMIEKRHRFHSARTFLSEELVPVDLHYEISWSGNRALDSLEVWRDAVESRIFDEPVLMPSPERELLIIAGHSAFQHHYVTLGDFLIMLRLLSKVKRLGTVKHPAVRNILRYVVAKGLLMWDIDLRDKVEGLESAPPLRIESLVSPIYFLPLDLIPRKKPIEILDWMLTIYRRLRYVLFRWLPYNEDWLVPFLKSKVRESVWTMPRSCR